MDSILGKKIDQTQGFLEDGTRVPLSVISVAGNVVAQIKTEEKEGYNSIQIGFGENKRPSKAIAGHIKKAGLTTAPRFFREIRVDETPSTEVGAVLNVAEVLEAGDIVDISGTSKGKGYAGVIKRHHFHGGPKTHGQSDRERAPGAIGQGTTPGRVYRGKKMSGNMGNDNVTVKNLLVLDVSGDTILVKGLVPGVRGGFVVVKKVGTKKKFVPLFMKKVEEVEEKTDDVVVAEEKVETAVDTVKTEEDVKTVEETVSTSDENVQAESVPSEAENTQDLQSEESEDKKSEEADSGSVENTREEGEKDANK